MEFTPTACDDANIATNVVLFYKFIPYAANDCYFKPSKIEELIDVKNDSQFYEAILYFTKNYRSAFGYTDKKFHSDAPLTRGDLWTRVFGSEAVPVNFVLSGQVDDERIITRSEFALFLQESLLVLTYKVLP